MVHMHRLYAEEECSEQQYSHCNQTDTVANFGFADCDILVDLLVRLLERKAAEPSVIVSLYHFAAFGGLTNINAFRAIMKSMKDYRANAGPIDKDATGRSKTTLLEARTLEVLRKGICSSDPGRMMFVLRSLLLLVVESDRAKTQEILPHDIRLG
jgi:hypothetical protein